MSAVMERAVSEQTDDRARYYLLIWADWWREADIRIGFPPRVPILATGGGWDTEAQYAELDNAAAEAADATMADLAGTHRLLLMNTYQTTVVRYRRLNVTHALAEAHTAFMRGMRRRGFD